jgi:hypothetical protein
MRRLAVTLLLLAAACQTAQSVDAAAIKTYEDWNSAAEARALHQQWHQDPAHKQCFPFSTDASIARDNFEYPDADTGARKTAQKGARILDMTRLLVFSTAVTLDLQATALSCTVVGDMPLHS